MRPRKCRIWRKKKMSNRRAWCPKRYLMRSRKFAPSGNRKKVCGSEWSFWKKAHEKTPSKLKTRLKSGCKLGWPLDVSVAKNQESKRGLQGVIKINDPLHTKARKSFLQVGLPPRTVLAIAMWLQNSKKKFRHVIAVFILWILQPWYSASNNHADPGRIVVPLIWTV